ncbi:MAG: hypothetical protein ACI9MC_000528, partial [Kiritimatiellia bacterium]
ALEALGAPQVMIVPNGMHRLDASVYKERYPDLVVCCPASAQAKVEQVVAVDNTDVDALSELGMVVHSPAGGFENAYEVPLDDGVALICTDILFHMEHLPGLSGLIMRYITRSTGFFGVTGVGRFFIGKGLRGLTEWLREQSGRRDLRVLTVAHGRSITVDVSGHLKAAAERL